MIRRTHRNSGAVAIPLVFGLGGQMLGGWAMGSTGAIVGGFVGAYLGSMLFPQSADDTSLPKAGSFATQMTLSGSPIPIIYGTCKAAGNVIILGDPHPYTIKHKSRGGGGKGMGGGSKAPDTEELRYRRSFLIGICEGPADVGAIWAGKDQISIGSATIFRGDGNIGLAALTGKEFSHYKNLCCAYFQEYDIGSSDALPMFTFEVNTQPVYMFNFFVSGQGSSSPVVQAFNDDGSLKKTFAMAGPSGKFAYNVVIHPNGFVYYTVGDLMYKCDKEGNLITSFGGIGYISVVSFASSYCNTIVVDLIDGYIYATGGSLHSHPHVFKIDPVTGAKLWSVSENWPTPEGCDFYGDELFITSTSAYGIHPRIIEVKNKSDGATTRIVNGTDGANHLIIDQDTHVVYTCGVVVSGKNVWKNQIPGSVVVSGTVGSQTLNAIEIFVLTGSPSLTTIYVGGTRDVVIGATLYGVASGFGLLYHYDTIGTVHKIKRIGGYLFVLHDLAIGEGGKLCNVSMLDLELNFLRGWVLDTSMPFLDMAMSEVNSRVPEEVQVWNPIDIQKDLITNTRYGGGISSSLINNDSAQSVWQHCEDNGIGLAIIIDRRQPLLDWLDYIMSHYFGYMRLG